MARTIGYSRFRDSKPSYLLRAYSGATYSNFSLCTGRSRFVTHDAVRSIVIEETTAQDLVCSKSAAATIVRTAIPSDGVLPSSQLTRSIVLSEVKPRRSKPFRLSDSRNTSVVLSVDPPSTFTITTRSLTKFWRTLSSLARTVCAIVTALMYEGIPTNRSTSPTLISWRIKSSPRKLSSAKLRACSPALKLNAGGTQPSAPVVQINLDPPQAEPIKLI